MIIEKTAKSIEEAVQAAIAELGTEKENVNIEVLEQPAKGIFGIIGSKLAKVRVTLKEEKAAAKVKEDKAENKDIRITDFTLEKEKARKFLRDVLEAMEIKAEIRIKDKDENLLINLSGPRIGAIIGRR
ncbi:MAG TPA: Jag N-terminal domain-containing protein, partial [Bacillota bacterium]|nr:Jag N-terminal domain-containing protein [Bacillota bacterium]